MKKVIIFCCIFLSATIFIGCSDKNTSTEEIVGDVEIPYQLDLSSVAYTPVTPADTITVQGKAITVENRLEIGDTITDVALDLPVGEFDQIETTTVGALTGYTVIYSVPSLDTPVCTLQTRQIDLAGKERPLHNFVIVSHDTPFALKRFSTDNKIYNAKPLSDSRRKEFALSNGLYMNEYNLMARAIIIVDDNLEVLYVDYADEVTDAVDLLNAFAFLKELP